MRWEWDAIDLLYACLFDYAGSQMNNLIRLTCGNKSFASRLIGEPLQTRADSENLSDEYKNLQKSTLED